MEIEAEGLLLAGLAIQTMSSRPIYAVAAVLVCMLVVSSSAAVYFYYEAGQLQTSSSEYASEVSASNERYDKLSSNYDSLLSLYNESLGVLASSVGVMNTSLPLYSQANSQLSQLWTSYVKLRPSSAVLYSPHMLIEFGNGTKRWFNATAVQPGWMNQPEL